MDNDCLIVNKRGQCANTIAIIGRRWFDKHHGNTYHATEVYVDGEFIGKEDFKYGYGDQFIETGMQILQDNHLMEATEDRLPSGMDKDYYEFEMDRRKHPEKYVVSVADVERKGELKQSFMR